MQCLVELHELIGCIKNKKNPFAQTVLPPFLAAYQGDFTKK
jgi:hypothetical protein